MDSNLQKINIETNKTCSIGKEHVIMCIPQSGVHVSTSIVIL
jgi:hypothetical protein